MASVTSFIRNMPASSLQAYDATVNAYLGFELATGDRLKETLTLDPAMPLAHYLKGCFLLLFAKQDLAAAAAAYDVLLLDHPHDIVALKLAQYLHFYLGAAEGMRGSVARPFYAWDETVPGYGFVLGLKAFALEECGDYAAAETAGREAVERNPADLWAAHAVAHVMEMQDARPRATPGSAAWRRTGPAATTSSITFTGTAACSCWTTAGSTRCWRTTTRKCAATNPKTIWISPMRSPCCGAWSSAASTSATAGPNWPRNPPPWATTTC
ncbi:MAG: hypothetical protein V6Z86_02595 [Hyphomicrobiales bacterium]